jgi:sugar phosphate isomerase/epimerase
VTPSTPATLVTGPQLTKKLHSVQLYTLRDSITSNFMGTLQRVAAMGFESVELHRMEMYRDDYKTALPAAGLRPSGAHSTLVDGNTSSAIQTAAELGVGTLIESRIDAARWTTPADILDAAADLNAVAKQARDAGVVIGYHNHDHEIRNQFDGRTGLELFAEALDDDIVLELDVWWAEVGGISAAELGSRLGTRVTFLHVKDGSRSDHLAQQQPAGKGEMPITDVLQAVPDAIRVIELDDYHGDMLEAVEQSLRYLEQVDR